MKTTSKAYLNKAKELLKDLDLNQYGPLIALIVLVIISSFASPYFLKWRNITNVLRQISYTGIIALGMTFVIIAGGIDLSVGSMTAFVGGIVIILLNHFGGGMFAILIAIGAALLMGAAAGAFNGLIITKGKVAPFIVTLGTWGMFRSLTLYISGAGEFRSNSFLFPKLGMGYFLRIPIPVWVLLVMAIFYGILLNRTKFGRYACAVGSNERVAKYSAINVQRIKFITYIITGFNVAVTSVLLSSRLNSINPTTAGSGFELDAIAAVIIGGTALSGGTGSILGTLIGAIILGIVNNMLNLLGVSPYLQGTVRGLVIIGAVLIQRKRG
ncbi:ABC transporter permease [Candidatus Bipolaricaulota bacterium]|nr:ABC transporter permease [Candidatus Bipolaricaulota bacterium]